MTKPAAWSNFCAKCTQLTNRLFVLALSVSALFAMPAGAQSPPTITKAFSSATVSKNQSVTMTFTITNPNPATDLTNVAFNDDLPSGLIIANPDSLNQDGCVTGTITPSTHNINLTGATVIANGGTCSFFVDVLAVAGGTQVNTTGTVSSAEGGTGGTATASVDVLLADLTIAKTHSGNFQRGQVGAVYTITVSNNGGADSDAPVTVTDTLPAGLTATSISGTGWTCSTPPTLSCTRPDVVAAGASFDPITLTVNVAATAPSSVTNTATVSGGGESNTSNDTATDPTTIVPESDLTITKTHTGSFQPAQVGATYSITVRNVGPGSTTGTVQVVDSPPSSLTATAITGTGWTCDLPTLTCTRSDVLPPGGSYPAITLTVNVAAGTSGTIANIATVSGGGEINTANDTATDQTHVGAPVQITATGPTNLQVPRGGSTSTILQVDAAGGIGAITFACGGAPPGVTCSFNPASESQLSAQVTMTVTASAGAVSIFPTGIGKAPSVYVVVLLLVGVGAVVRKKVRRLRLQWALSLGILALLLVLAIAGCGRGGSSLPPTGTFPISVTGTSASGASGSTTVNLTVL